MSTVAIVGSGIAGLGTAHRLHQTHDITVFDSAGYVGGHTNTVTVNETGTPVAIDTGFMVFNEVTYPNLTQLFREIGIEPVETEMSFGVSHVPTGIEYCGSSLARLFARRRNLLNRNFLGALYDVARFNREAHEALAGDRWEGMTLAQYATSRSYGENFLTYYLLPMASAVWSTRFEDVRSFPAMTLLRFFRNHGLLGGLSGHHQWLTIPGGARRYVERMTEPFRDRIVLNNGVERVWRVPEGVIVRLADGSRRMFEKVVLACHADDALRMLADPTPDERRLLGAFRYQRNVAQLHTDEALMPKARGAWASWNVRVDQDGDGSARATTIYWMNRLQNVSQRVNYFVSIDDPGLVDPAKVLRTITYHHPLFDNRAVEAQRELPELNSNANKLQTYYCGSYFRYGFHEDAYASGLAAAEAVISNGAARRIAA